MEAITEEKDLGVTIDWDMNFHMHVSKTANKASRMLGLVRTTFTCIDDTSQAIDHYGSPSFGIWKCELISKFRRDKLAQLKKIQRRATKLIPNLRSQPYRDRLYTLRLPYLYYSRRRSDMLQVDKLLKGIDRLECVRI